MTTHQTAAGRIAELKQQMESARNVAVGLEQQVARVEALLREWSHQPSCCVGCAGLELHAALNPDGSEEA